MKTLITILFLTVPFNLQADAYIDVGAIFTSSFTIDTRTEVKTDHFGTFNFKTKSDDVSSNQALMLTIGYSKNSYHIEANHVNSLDDFNYSSVRVFKRFTFN